MRGDGGIEPLELAQAGAKIAPGRGMARGQLGCPRMACDGFLEAFHFPQRDATVGEHGRVVRTQGRGLVVAGERFLKPVQGI